MKQKIVVFLLLLSPFAFSQNSLFEARNFILKQDTLKYRVLYPENYDKSKKYPLLIFLHGSGERGNDNLKQLKHGSAQFLTPENRQKYPSIVIFPQCPEKEFWAPRTRTAANELIFPVKAPMEKPLFLAKKLIDDFLKKESVDKKRIYIAGLSMGGMGTFDMIARYPKLFAAAVPICGGINTERLKKLKKMPIRMYHGGSDDVVSKEFSRSAFYELKANGSDVVEYIEFPGMGHNSWDAAFAEPDFLSWIFSQKKK